jgi:hypothetical protein
LDASIGQPPISLFRESNQFRRSSFVRLSNPTPLTGVSHAEWPNDKYERTPTWTGKDIFGPLEAPDGERRSRRRAERSSKRAKKL